jgi:hypothetical protein
MFLIMQDEVMICKGSGREEAGRAETFISNLHFPKEEGEVSNLCFI